MSSSGAQLVKAVLLAGCAFGGGVFAGYRACTLEPCAPHGQLHGALAQRADLGKKKALPAEACERELQQADALVHALRSELDGMKALTPELESTKQMLSDANMGREMLIKQQELSQRIAAQSQAQQQAQHQLCQDRELSIQRELDNIEQARSTLDDKSCAQLFALLQQGGASLPSAAAEAAAAEAAAAEANGSGASRSLIPAKGGSGVGAPANYLLDADAALCGMHMLAGGAKRTRAAAPAGASTPGDADELQLSYSLLVGPDVVFSETNIAHILGGESTPAGLKHGGAVERALRSMRRGARARFALAPEEAFGASSHNLPSCAHVCAHVCAHGCAHVVTAHIFYRAPFFEPILLRFDKSGSAGNEALGVGADSPLEIEISLLEIVPADDLSPEGSSPRSILKTPISAGGGVEPPRDGAQVEKPYPSSLRLDILISLCHTQS